MPQFDPGMTTVTLDFRPDGEGCELTLTHEGVAPEWAKGSKDGRRRILAGLEPALEGVKAAGWS